MVRALVSRYSGALKLPSLDYAKSKATAERLISNFGQSGTLTQTVNSGASYNPTRTSTDYACKLSVMSYRERDIDGSDIQRGDKQVYLSTEGLSVVPSENDLLSIGGVKHKIVDLMPLSPAGMVVFWKAQVRT